MKQFVNDVMIEFGDDFIAITDSNDNEIVRWVEDEWIEDSDVTFAIANAILIASTEGAKGLKNALDN